MKKIFSTLILIFFVVIAFSPAMAQCSVCSKTAMQLGEKPAIGLNRAILYLMFMPILVISFIAFRWWKNQSKSYDENS